MFKYLVAFLIPLSAISQDKSRTTVTAPTRNKDIRVDTFAITPGDTVGARTRGRVVFKSSDSTLYVFNGLNWQPTGKGTGNANVDLSPYAFKAVPIVAPASTNYTLALSDASNIVSRKLPVDNTVTVPANANVPLPIGTQIGVSQDSTGSVSIIGASGVTIIAADSVTKLRTKGSMATLVKKGVDTWQLVGDLYTNQIGSIVTTVPGINSLTNTNPNVPVITTDRGGTWIDLGVNDGTYTDNGGTIKITSDNHVKKRIYDNLINFKWFGAAGDGVYNTTGDTKQLLAGTYNETYLSSFLAQQKDGGISKSGGFGSNLSDGIYRLHSSLNGFVVNKNNNYLYGTGIGSSKLHFERTNSVDELAFRFGRDTGNADTRLVRGGGLSNMTLGTNNANIIKNGLQLDYTEYQTFENLALEGFYSRALYGGFWEAYFKNITIRDAGAGLTATNGIPDNGVLDFDSHTTLPYRDACNNTTFDKLTFSSCFGTHIRAVAYANTIVNILINGINLETSHGDGGVVDTLPVMYFNGVKNFNFDGGFTTINETGVNRDAYAVVISNDDRNAGIRFKNFTFSQNITTGDPVNKYTQNATRRLKSFFYLSGTNASVSLDNSIISDPSGSVGVGLSTKYLIDGVGGTVYLNNTVFEVKQGVWDSTNIVNPAITKVGTYTIKYYSNTGLIANNEYKYSFAPSVDTSNNSNQSATTSFVKAITKQKVSGSGTTNYLVKWTNGVLGSANVSDNGSIVTFELPARVYSNYGNTASFSLYQSGKGSWNFDNQATTGDLRIYSGLLYDQLKLKFDGTAVFGYNVTVPDAVDSSNAPTLRQVIKNINSTKKVLADADYTVTATDNTLILPEPTAVRTLTLPLASTMPNKDLWIVCRSSTTGRWILSGSFVKKDQTGSTFIENFINSGLVTAVTYHLVSDGSKWFDINQ